jgi:predicted DNA-binding transcriptional regulator YafY
MLDKIRAAVLENRVIAIEYDKAPQGTRLVQPHILFQSTAGRILLDAFQIDGVTTSGEGLPSWRRFSLDKILHVDVLPQTFRPADGYNPQNKDEYAKILAQCT